MPRMTQHDRDFAAGMLAALAVVHDFDNPVIYDHIVGTADEKALLAAARKEASMAWSGMSAWKKRRKEEASG